MFYMEEVYLKILSDIHCEVYVDNEFVLAVKKDVLTKVPMKQGEYFVTLVSVINSNYSIEQIVSLDRDRILSPNFIQIVKSKPELLRDRDFVCLDGNNILNLVTGETIPTSYTSISHYCDGVAIVHNNSFYGLIERAGDVIVPCIYDEIDYFSQGIARI